MIRPLLLVKKPCMAAAGFSGSLRTLMRCLDWIYDQNGENFFLNIAFFFFSPLADNILSSKLAFIFTMPYLKHYKAGCECGRDRINLDIWEKLDHVEKKNRWKGDHSIYVQSDTSSKPHDAVEIH